MNHDGSRVIMRGDAHVRRPGDENHSPLDVRSQELTLLPDKDVVFTDLPALVVNGDSTMQGTGMRYDNKTSVLQVFSARDVKLSGKETAKKQSTKTNEQTVTNP